MRYFSLQFIKINFLLFFCLTLLTGVIYPSSVTLIAKIFFKDKSNGSLITDSKGDILGSKLIAQNFSTSNYLIGRDFFRKGPTNFIFNSTEKVNLAKKRAIFFLNLFPENRALVPDDLLFSSASGVDPHISLQSAYYQIERIAKARNIPVFEVQTIIDKHTESKFIGLFGEDTVNVLLVNLELDGKIITLEHRKKERIDIGI